MASFDPYLQWLGIPSQMRPLNHYILLGLRIFEGDSQKIAAAYKARMKLLEKLPAGPHGNLCQQVISEIGLAKRDLLDQDRKSKYDIALKKLLQQRQLELEQAQDESAQAQADSVQNLPADSQSSASESFPMLVPATRSDPPIDAPTIKSDPPRSMPQAHSEDLPSEDDEDDSGVLSVFSYLTDVRYLVALLTLCVLVMIATVKLFSPAAEQDGQTLPVARQTENGPAVEDVSAAKDPSVTLPRIAQADDDSFELPIQQGHLTGSGVKSGAQGITGWNAGDEAAWAIVVEKRGKGYFKCLITYRAKSESDFQIQLGNLKPRSFTLYPHDDDFEEEFIVRLAKASKTTDEQTFRIKATQAGANEVEIKQIRLVPNR